MADTDDGDSFADSLAKVRGERRAHDPKRKQSAQKGGNIVDEVTAYDALSKDITGTEDSGSDDDDDFGKGRRGNKTPEDGEEKQPEYMFFDFRKGAAGFPLNCEIVDANRAQELLEKQTVAAEDALKSKKSEEGDGDGANKSGNKFGPSMSWGSSRAEEPDNYDNAAQISEATFEVLQDGSTALIMKPGFRLKLKLNDLNEGGDDGREERDKKAAKAKKKKSKFSGSESHIKCDAYCTQ